MLVLILARKYYNFAVGEYAEGKVDDSVFHAFCDCEDVGSNLNDYIYVFIHPVKLTSYIFMISSCASNCIYCLELGSYCNRDSDTKHFCHIINIKYYMMIYIFWYICADGHISSISTDRIGNS